MAITKKDIQSALKRLREETGLPLSVEVWNPGDGATRYRLQLYCGDGTRNLGCVFQGAGSFHDALYLAINVAAEQAKKGEGMNPVNFTYKGHDGAKWGSSDFYEDFEDALTYSLQTGENFYTGWQGVKKEIESFCVTRREYIIIAQVSVSDDFDTPGFGEFEFTIEPDESTERTIERIKEALDTAGDEAEKNRRGNQVYEGFSIIRDGQWEETFILQLGGEYAQPPGDEYYWWGWQAFDPEDKQEGDEHIVPENVRKAMEEWIFNNYGKWNEPFTMDGWTIKVWE